MKNKVEECKRLHITALLLNLLHTLNFLKVEKANCENQPLHLSLFCLSSVHNSKTIWCMQIHVQSYTTKWLLCLEHYPFLIWDCVQDMTSKLWSGNCLTIQNNTEHFLIQTLQWLLRIFHMCMAQIVSPRQGNWVCVCYRLLQVCQWVAASVCLDVWVSFFLLGVLEDTSVQQKMLLCIVSLWTPAVW